MIKPMTYMGYTAKFEYDDECETFLGEVIDLNDIITFQGNSVDELRLAFHESVDAYIEYCAEIGESPEKPFSGKFSLRISKELHRAAAVQASMLGMSLNGFVERVLEENTGSVRHCGVHYEVSMKDYLLAAAPLFDGVEESIFPSVSKPNISIVDRVDENLNALAA